MTNRQPSILLYPRKTICILGSCIFFLVGAHVITRLAIHIAGCSRDAGLIRLFDLGKERSIATLFSTFLILLNAALFLSVGKVERVSGKSQRVWLLLSGLFCYLAIDEFCEVHEMLILPLRGALHTSGHLFYAWVIPYGLAVVLLAILIIPPLWRLDRRIKFWLFLSAVIYILAALGFDFIEGYSTTHGMQSAASMVQGFIAPDQEKISLLRQLGLLLRSNSVLVVCEESLEMIGQVMCTYALLTLIVSKHDGFAIRIPGDSSAS